MGKDYPKLVLERLSERYGYSLHTELKHKNETELFVSVFLSPQCTDKQVNKMTPALFSKYKSFKDYANGDMRTLQRYLSGLNYYKTKGRHLKRSSEMILTRFHGKVPHTIPELLELPGVGRKVANVILNEGFAINEGIAVDTHCGRVAHRLGFSRSKDPKKIEQKLMQKYSRNAWGKVSNLFIALGRDACKARDKQCARCVLNDICPSSTAP